MHVAVSLFPGSRASDTKLFGDAIGSYAVIDVLRASTSICTALHNGAEEVVPVADVPAARALKSPGVSNVLLAGEREGVRIEGFDLGNSPTEYKRETVGGKRLAFASTNGSVALAGAPPGVETIVAGLVNLTAAAERISSLSLPALLVCSGKLGGYSLEDAVCAGALIAKLFEVADDVEPANDAAYTAQALWDWYKGDPARALWQSEHGQFLISIGLGSDLAICADIDSVPVVPTLRNGVLIL
jgi:2-phosphosulfolactate phosphatase